MKMREFLGIERLDGCHYRVPVGPHLITPGNFLYGGCGLAACVEAMELESGRPIRWATAQFASYAGTKDILDITVDTVAAGRNVTQLRASARAGDREVLFVMGAAGNGSHTEGSFVEMPSVRPPLECPRRESANAVQVKGTLFEILEIRLATGRGWKELDGTPGSPTTSFWIRLPSHTKPSAATLSIYGDGVANGILQVTGRPMMGRSLDNTIRISNLVESEWILVDVRMQSYFEGFTHGQAYLWAESGELLGVASQTQTIKPRPETEGAPLWGGQRLVE